MPVGYRTLPGNSSRIMSPVTLDHEWPALVRLAIVVLCAAFGSIANAYFISTFMIERPLRKRGNVYLACSGLADFIITAFAMPIVATLLLSGQWDNIEVCRTVLYIVELSTYAYNILFALVGAETYYRLCRTPMEYKLFLTIRVSVISVLVFVCCAIVAGVGVFMPLDYDYCRREYDGNRVFRITTFCLLHALPFILSIYMLFSSACAVKRRGRKEISYRRSIQFDNDTSTTNLNIIAYLFYVVFWLPYLIIVHRYPETNNVKYYYAAWIAVLRSVFGSFLYYGINRQFRRSYTNIFYYCCCKSTLGEPLTHRHRRTEYKPPTPGRGDVRVHIMHHAVVGSPQRAGTSREAYEL